MCRMKTTKTVSTLLFFLFLLCGVKARAQLGYTPPAVGAYYLSGLSWTPFSGTGVGQALSYTPPASGMYYQDSGTLKWYPCNQNGCGGSGPSAYPAAGLVWSTGSAWQASYNTNCATALTFNTGTGPGCNANVALVSQLPTTIAAVTHKYLTSYTSTTELFTAAQPSCSDLSDAGSGCTGAASAVGANPTATATGAAINGSAATFMRSDAAPAIGTLNQSTTGTAANLSGTPTLPTGTAANTGTAGTGGTNIATQAYADASFANANILTGSASVANLATTTVLTLPNVAASHSFIASCSFYGGSAANYSTIATVSTQNASSNSAILQTGAGLAITMSGVSIQVTNTVGSGQTINCSAFRFQ